MSKADEIKEILEVVEELDKITPEQLDKAIKEVLQEIISKYKTTLYNSKTNETVVNIPKVFEMPAE